MPHNRGRHLNPPNNSPVPEPVRKMAFQVLHLLLAATSDLRHAFSSGGDQPWHDSVLTGAGWVAELIAGHPERIRTELGLDAVVFLDLLSELKQDGWRDSSSGGATLHEQLAIFLYCSVTGITSTHAGERFQRSHSTISK